MFEIEAIPVPKGTLTAQLWCYIAQDGGKACMRCAAVQPAKLPQSTFNNFNIDCFTVITYLLSKFSAAAQHSSDGVVMAHPSVQPNSSVAQEAVKTI